MKKTVQFTFSRKMILLLFVSSIVTLVRAQAPTITSFTPAIGPVGSLVTITGTNLTTPTSLTIGGATAIAISNNGTSLVAMVMPGATTGTISVSNTFGTANGVGNFSVTTNNAPNTQQGGKLAGFGTGQGWSCSLSADGNTAIVGAFQDNLDQGAVWIYTRSGTTWSQQGPKLVGTGNIGPARQGSSVSISADGNTAIVGGNSDNSSVGAAWIFTRSGTTWSQQGPKLVGTGSIGPSRQGAAVSISADGNTAIVGGWGDDLNWGASWIYTRNGATWSQQAKLIGAGVLTNAQQGIAVSLSADGNTAIVGGYSDNSNQGASWVFTRSGTTWNAGTKLVGTGNTGAARQGSAVFISADGNTAMVGGFGDNTDQGAAWVFTRSGSTWSQQGTKLVGTGNTGAAQQGRSVSLSADGNTAIVGGPNDNSNLGAAWIYTRSGTAWSQQGTKQVGTGNIGAAQQGFGVSLSGDGTTAIVGGYGDNFNTGASWIYALPTRTSVTGALSAFTTCSGTASAQQSFSVSGSTLLANIVVTPPSGFEVSTTSGSGFAPSVTLPQSGGIVASTLVYIRLTNTAIGPITGNVAITSTGSATQNVAVTGTANIIPTITLDPLNNVSFLSTVFSLPYSATTGSPNQYSITTGSPTAMPGFTAVSNATLPPSPISVAIPASAANTYNFVLSVRNTVTGCASTSNTNFTLNVVALPPPTITSFTPPSGTVGSLVTITGTNFTNPSTATIGGVAAIVISNTATSIVAMVMPGATTGTMSATSAGVTANSSSNFTVTPSLVPNVQQGSKLVGTGIIGIASQGFSVSISADGNTAIVGGNNDNSSQGAAWIYTRNGTTWSQQGSKLVGTGNIGPANLGSSVSISADGNTAIVGGNGDNTAQGAAWIFVRNGTTWSQQGPKLVGTGNIGFAWQGSSVSISADGNTAIVGGHEDNSLQGAAWIFTRSGTTWSQQGTKLVGTGNVGAAAQANSVALSADGNTALLGGPGDNSSQGATWIFTRSGTTWSQQGTKLVGTGSVGSTIRQGVFVSLSANGNTALVGGNQDNSNTGAVWIFIRSGNTWSQQGTKLVGTGAIGAALQGNSVSLSGDGNTAFVGGFTDNTDIGATWIFTRSGTTWSQQGTKLVGTGNVGTGRQGNSVSISADGNTTIVGGPLDNSNLGAAWIYQPLLRMSVTGTLSTFTSCAGIPSAQQSVSISGSSLSANIVVTPPAGFEVSTTSGSGFGSSVTLQQSGGTVASTLVYIRLTDSASGTLMGNITLTSIGSATQYVAVNGTVNVLPTITLGTVSGINTLSTSFNLPYSATTGNPNQYSITTGSPTAMPSFTAVSNAILPASPISVTIPASAANTYNFVATVRNSVTGCVSINNNFTVTVPPPPSITSFATASGPVGSLVTIIGTNFVSPTTVTIGGVAAIVISNTGTSLLAMVMPGATTGMISVTNALGTVNSIGSFTVTASALPNIQQGGKLVGTGNIGAGRQGRSVSISADGNTAIIGGDFDNSNQGAVWIYIRNGNTWSQQGGKLVGTGAIGSAVQGISVSISADGNTAIVGGSGDNTNQGAAWIFIRSGTTWSQQGTKLVGTGAIGNALQGTSVSISADGNTAIIGASGDNSNQGAAWIFTRTGTTWNQQGTKLVGTGSIGAAFQGRSVSLSADGNTAIVGGDADNLLQGAAWIYIRTGTTWSQQGAKLVGTGAVGGSYQGTSVSISADGNTAIVGGIGDNNFIGASWIFTRSGTTWSQQGTKLVGTGNTGAGFQGSAVSLSASGNTAIIGASGDNSNQGASWIFTRSGTTWSQQGTKLVGTGNTGAARQGGSISISANGNASIVGGFEDNASVGAVWIYNSPTIITTGNLNAFTSCAGTPSTQQSFTVSGFGLTAGILVSPPTGFEVSTTSGSGFASSVTIPQSGGAVTPTTIFVRLTSSASGSPLGNITCTSTGVTTQNVVVSGIVNALPTITLGTVAVVNTSATSFSLPYTATTGSPNQYSITTGTPTAMPGFIAVSNANLSTSPIIVSIPSSVANTYNFILTSRNSSTGCVSVDNSFSVTAMPLPTITSFTPSSGSVGSLVTITGTNLNTPTALTIGGVSAIPISNTGTSLVAMVMPGSATGTIGITTSSGSTNSSNNFTVMASIPPTAQQGGKLVGTGGVGTSRQGSSVSLSADGNTAIVGAFSENSFQGTAWIYTRSGTTWSQLGGKLVPSGIVGTAQLGYSVSISADGNTAIVGGNLDNSGQGAAWVFIRSGNSFILQGSKLVGTGVTGPTAQQGWSVDLSADGNTAIVGGISDNSNQGATWVFTRSGGVWSQQGSKLVGTGNSGAANQGRSVSLSADGNTAIVGGNNDSSGVGAVWVFTRSGGVWSQQGNKLVGTGAVGNSGQGWSSSLSADGNTAIVGGWLDDGNKGATWVYSRNGSTWSQQGTKLVGTGGIGGSLQGVSVSLSADGNTAFIGGSGDNGNQGGTWLFTRSGSTWSQQGVKLLGTGNNGAAGQGNSVNLSADGNIAIVGGSADNSNQGAAWVFGAPPIIITSGVLNAFNACFGTASVQQSFTVSGSNIGSSITVTAPAGFEVSSTSGSGFTSGIALTQSGGIVNPTTIFVRLSSTTIGNPSGNITCTTNGATTQNIPVSGTVNALPSIALGAVQAVLPSATSFSLPYTTSTGSPSQYSITSGMPTPMPGFTAVSNALLTTSPISVTIPPSAINTYNFIVTVRNTTTGCVSVNNNFALTVDVPPTITSFTPSSGSVGSLVTITGTNLSSPNSLAIGGGTAIRISGTSTSVVAMVMPGATSGIIGITTIGGSATSTGIFTVTTNVPPSAQQGSKLVGTGNVGAAFQGRSVSVSCDGNTAIVGGDFDNSSQGAVWIYTRSGGVWSQQGTKLVGTGNIGAAMQGYSVSLSADGNTALVGGYVDNGGIGAAWVFTRTAGVWSQQGGKLVGTGGVGPIVYQGASVSLSADGNTAIIGGYGDNNNQGAVWIFTRTGTSWSQQGTKLVGTGNTGAARQGYAVNLSADGNTAAVGGYFDNSQVGATWIFTRNGGIWSQQGSKLVGTGNTGASQQGSSVSLSADGNTALVGGNADSSDHGAAWTFIRNGGVWSQQGSKLVGTGNIGAAQQGFSVSLSADGNTAAVSGEGDNSFIGAVWLYTRSGTVWSQQGSKLVGTGVAFTSRQSSVSLSADGNILFIGGRGDNFSQGAVWVFGPGPFIVTSGTLNTFVACTGTTSAQQSFTVSGTNLGNNIIITPPVGFEVSTTSGSGFTSSVTLTPSGGILSPSLIFVRLASSASGSPSGNITCTSIGATTQNVAVSGTVNTPGTWTGSTSNAWGNTANWSCPLVPTSTTNVSIPVGTPNMPIITDAQQANNITIATGATLTLNNASSSLSIFGTFTNNGTFNQTAGELVMSGSAIQTLPGGTYTKLNINNTNGVNLGGNVTITDSLKLNAGRVALGANNVTLTGSTSQISGANNNRFLSTNGTGSLIVQNIGTGQRTGGILFPVGANIFYSPLVLNNAGVADQFSVRLADSVNQNGITGARTNSFVVGHTWFVSEATVGGTNATVSLQWNGLFQLPAFNRSASYVSFYNNGSWQSTTATAATGGDPFTQTRSGLTVFNNTPFGVGSNGVLPVDLLSFDATKYNQDVKLNWATASELNNDYFEVQRSVDGVTFEMIGKMNGKGNSTITNNYNFTDKNAFNVHQVLYYRLLQVDFDGTATHSNIVSVNSNDAKNVELTVMPNPFTDDVKIAIQSSEEQQGTIVVSDVNGKIVFSEKVNLVDGTNYVALTHELTEIKAGVYSVSVTTLKNTLTTKLVKQQ